MQCIYIFLLFSIYQVHERHLAMSKSVNYLYMNSALAKRSLRQTSTPLEFAEELQKSDNILMNFLRNRRSISNAVVETANCEHEHLIECEEYDSDEKECRITYGGMRCCICTGQLKMLRTRKWFLW